MTIEGGAAPKRRARQPEVLPRASGSRMLRGADRETRAAQAHGV
jgi:hypothetical protein